MIKTNKRKKKLKKRKKLNEFQKQQEIKYAKIIEVEEKIKNLIIFLKTNNNNLNYTVLGKIKEIIVGIKDFIDLSQVEKTIKQVFRIFDLNATGELELKFLKDCMFALGLCFTESEFKMFQGILILEPIKVNERVSKKITSRVEISNTGKIVKFEDFLNLMIFLIISNLYTIKSEQDLKSAFECLAINLDNNNETEWIDLENVLILSGEKFNSDEIESMRAFLSVDQNKNTFNYLNYIILLSNEHEKLEKIKINISEKYVEKTDIIKRFFF
jgi:hypothetical protein